MNPYIKKYLLVALAVIGLGGNQLHGIDGDGLDNPVHFVVTLSILAGMFYGLSKFLDRPHVPFKPDTIKYRQSDETNNKIIFDRIRLIEGDSGNYIYTLLASRFVESYDTTNHVAQLLRREFVDAQVMPLLKEGKDVVIKLSGELILHLSGTTHTSENVMYDIISLLCTHSCFPMKDWRQQIRSIIVNTPRIS